jgi:hypothetical protein
MEDKTRQFVKLLFFCGLATILQAFFYGSWFGIASLTKTALWIVPTEQTELMMSYSILNRDNSYVFRIVYEGAEPYTKGARFSMPSVMPDLSL